MVSYSSSRISIVKDSITFHHSVIVVFLPERSSSNWEWRSNSCAAFRRAARPSLTQPPRPSLLPLPFPPLRSLVSLRRPLSCSFIQTDGAVDCPCRRRRRRRERASNIERRQFDSPVPPPIPADPASFPCYDAPGAFISMSRRSSCSLYNLHLSMFIPDSESST